MISLNFESLHCQNMSALPYALAPAAAYGHLMSHYSKYIDKKSTKDPTKYYINGFETIHGGSDIYYNDDGDNEDDQNEDDIYSNPPDDDLGATHQQGFAREYAEQYLYYLQMEHQGDANVNINANLSSSTTTVDAKFVSLDDYREIM